jgi:hypothetical protein
MPIRSPGVAVIRLQYRPQRNRPAVVASLLLVRTSAAVFYRRQVAERGLGAFLVERQGRPTE